MVQWLEAVQEKKFEFLFFRIAATVGMDRLQHIVNIRIVIAYSIKCVATKTMLVSSTQIISDRFVIDTTV